MSPDAKPITRNCPSSRSARRHSSPSAPPTGSYDRVDPVAGDPPCARLDVFARRVDHRDRAAAHGHVALVGRRRGGDHFEAERPAHVDRREPDAASGAEHQQRLPRLHPRPVHEREERGHVALHEGGRLTVGKRRGHGHHASARRHHFGRETTCAARDEHAVTQLHAVPLPRPARRRRPPTRRRPRTARAA